MNIVKGIQKKPVKVVIYGSEGIGKSTLASQFPDPLFIDTENGTARLDVSRVPCTESWTELLSLVNEVTVTTPHMCETLVIDTADWAEQLCVNYICKRDSTSDKVLNGIEDYGYGKGYKIAFDEFKKLLNALNKVIAAGINVVIVAHAATRKFELPDQRGQFDKWEMKLSRNIAPAVREWGDAVLFCNFETFVTTDNRGSNGKATGGKRRIIYTNHTAIYDAKNRFNLPDELPMEWNSIKSILDYTEPARPAIAGIDTPTKQKTAARQSLDDFMEQDAVTPEEFMAVAVARGKANEGDTIDDLPDDIITKWAIKYWKSVMSLINENRNKEK